MGDMTKAIFPPGEVTEIRCRLLDLTGFDLFTSPRFIESFVCNICSLQQTNKQANCDAVTAAYERVEIKHSNPVRHNVLSDPSEFLWQGLQGSTGKGKDVDAYIMVGFNGRFLRFFVFPDIIIGEKKSLTISFSPRNKWLKYETTIGHLQQELKAAIAFNRLSRKL